MKKMLLMLIVSLYSLTAYAVVPTVYLDGLAQYKLNSITDSRYQIFGHTSGSFSAGICRIILRSTYNGDFRQLAERFNFIYGVQGGAETPVTPIIKNYALMFQLAKKTDFTYDYIRIESKNGKSIGKNISEILGDKTISAIAGTCY
jgi:hypothetical protein